MLVPEGLLAGIPGMVPVDALGRSDGEHRHGGSFPGSA
jgi:hypothetical protein